MAKKDNVKDNVKVPEFKSSKEMKDAKRKNKDAPTNSGDTSNRI